MSQSDRNTAATTTERTSDVELVVTRIVKGPPRLVYQAWADPALFPQWWAPKSFCMTILSYEADVRTGGTYRLVMSHATSDQPVAFFGKYLEVVPGARIVWTNDEGDDEGSVTTVTFTENAGQTLVVVHERFPSKAALEEAIASGSTSGWGEQLAQLEEFVGETAGEA